MGDLQKDQSKQTSESDRPSAWRRARTNSVIPSSLFQARIRVKNRKRKADEPSCPVCSERLSGSPEELNQHVERCLNKHNGNPAGQNAGIDDEEVDVEGDPETFEEYEWAGQRRVRATSMLVGGFSGEPSLSMNSVFHNSNSTRDLTLSSL